jgi:hypothetical protein
LTIRIIDPVRRFVSACAGGDVYVAATFTVGRLCAQKGELAKCATGVRASAAFIAREVITHFLIGPFAD